MNELKIDMLDPGKSETGAPEAYLKLLMQCDQSVEMLTIYISDLDPIRSDTVPLELAVTWKQMIAQL